jgi:type III secretion protein J
VFIKHQPNVDLEFLVPQIRRLVSSAIEGLDYAAVTVVLTESMAPEPPAPKGEIRMVSVLPGLAVAETDASYFWRLVYGVGGLIMLLLAVTVFSAVKYFRAGGKLVSRRQAEEMTLVEPS